MAELKMSLLDRETGLQSLSDTNLDLEATLETGQVKQMGFEPESNGCGSEGKPYGLEE